MSSDADMGGTLSGRTAKGVFWSLLEQFLQRGTGVLVTLLLAGFLSPNDYGLMAIMAVFLAIAGAFMNFGFLQALIRLQPAQPEHFSTVFVANLLLGLASYALLFGFAPFIARLYGESALVPLLRVAGLVVIINALQVVHQAHLSRAMNFRARVGISLPAALASGGLAILLAWLGAGAWALVAQALCVSVVSTALLWRLGLWRLSWHFSRDAFSALACFSYKLFLSGLLDIVFRNLYVAIIARLFSTSTAGLYFFANQAKELVIQQLVSAVQRVTYPALATVQDDGPRLKAGYRKVITVSCFLLFPVMLLLAALAEPLFEALLPPHWLPAAPYLQLMCLGALLYPVHAINLNVLQVKGRSDLFLGLEVLKRLMVLPILFMGSRYGVEGILIGNIMASLLAYLPNSYYSVRLIDYRYGEQLADFLPALLVSALVAGGVWSLVKLLPLQPLLSLLLYGLLGTLAYVAIAMLCRLQGGVLLLGMLKSRYRKRSE